MIRRFLSLLLVASITACPLICRGGLQCCASAPAAAAHGCCESCHKPKASDSKSAPRELPSKTPGGCEGCICGGAVIEDSTLPQVDVGSLSLPLPESHVVAIAPDHSRSSIGFSVLLPDDGINQGRAMRCLMSSYLC
jgi:hypothetical protein